MRQQPNIRSYSSATLFGRTLAPLAGGFILSAFSGMGGLLPFKAVYLLAFGLSIPALSVFSCLFAIVAISLVFGLGVSFATVATSAYTGEIADKTKVGASMGALSSVMDIGHSSGPAVTGFIVGAFSIRAGFMASVAICFAAAVFFVLATMKKPGR